MARGPRVRTSATRIVHLYFENPRIIIDLCRPHVFMPRIRLAASAPCRNMRNFADEFMYFTSSLLLASADGTFKFEELEKILSKVTSFYCMKIYIGQRTF